jgi:hypothetical protein
MQLLQVEVVERVLQIMLQAEGELVDFVLVHHFQFAEQQVTQLQLEQEELVDQDQDHLKLEYQDQIQHFQQSHQQVEEVEVQYHQQE